jgi:hypothetical protein
MCLVSPTLATADPVGYCPAAAAPEGVLDSVSAPVLAAAQRPGLAVLSKHLGAQNLVTAGLAMNLLHPAYPQLGHQAPAAAAVCQADLHLRQDVVVAQKAKRLRSLAVPNHLSAQNQETPSRGVSLLPSVRHLAWPQELNAAAAAACPADLLQLLATDA